MAVRNRELFAGRLCTVPDNLLNPKSVLFGAAMLVVIFPPGMSLPQILFVGANQLVVESMFYAFTFGLLADHGRGYLRAKKYI